MTIESTISELKASIAEQRLQGVLADSNSLKECALDHSKPVPCYSDDERWMEDACALVISRMAAGERTAGCLSEAFAKWRLNHEQVTFLASLAFAPQPEAPE